MCMCQLLVKSLAIIYFSLFAISTFSREQEQKLKRASDTEGKRNRGKRRVRGEGKEKRLGSMNASTVTMVKVCFMHLKCFSDVQC